jgi:3-hydroxyethyl bacteriochlorophyllide a dehydrogenase
MAQIVRNPGGKALTSAAVVLQRPRQLKVSDVELIDPGPADVLVSTRWSSISSGTERLLYDGRMPPFPGMSYPLVPGYESVGDVVWAGPDSNRSLGERVFVPGATCYRDVSALFGGASARLVTAGDRVTPVAPSLGADAVLLALAATAWHALELAGHPDLIVGHGVLGRLLARLAVVKAQRDQVAELPTVWETSESRRDGAQCYRVCDPSEDERRNYRCVVDASGSAGQLDEWISRLAPGGQIVLAGFYSEPVSFTFPPAFMRELRLQVAAEFRPEDMAVVAGFVGSGQLDLGGLVTHVRPSVAAASAYEEAFEVRSCLKMVLEWEDAQ